MMNEYKIGAMVTFKTGGRMSIVENTRVVGVAKILSIAVVSREHYLCQILQSTPDLKGQSFYLRGDEISPLFTPLGILEDIL